MVVLEGIYHVAAVQDAENDDNRRRQSHNA
jgi:hypothetical protein